MKAMQDLSCRLVTTNYDTVLEQVFKRNSLTSGNEINSLLDVTQCGKLKHNVGHVHGHIEEHSSLVLFQADYKSEEKRSTFDASFDTPSTRVFVGCGATVLDSNFLRLWANEHDTETRVKHYFFTSPGSLETSKSIRKYLKDSFGVDLVLVTSSRARSMEAAMKLVEDLPVVYEM